MELYELIKKYGTGKGESMMWSTLHIISDHIEKSMDEKHKTCLLRDLYGEMSGGHYNEEFAHDDVSGMYYIDLDGTKRYAPYWTDGEVRQVYENTKQKFPSSYNFWDFYVALQMTKSDNCPMLKNWFPDATEEVLQDKIIELTVNWLKDEDNPFKDKKVWGYLNSSKR